MESGFAQFSTLHQRIGEHRTDPAKLYGWGKIDYRFQEQKGKEQFGYRQNMEAIRFGQEVFAKETDTGGIHRLAFSADYAYTSATFEDRMRPNAGLSKKTGKLNGHDFSLGAYYTRTSDKGAYIDLVGRASYLLNRFEDVYKSDSKQRGQRIGASLEGGVPFYRSETGYLLEGQAQLSYFYTHYNRFHDSISEIGAINAHAARGRLGVRFTKDKSPEKKVRSYALVNVLHTFTKQADVEVDNNDGTRSSFNESFANTYGEIGAGIQGYVSENAALYLDARYQRGFGHHPYQGVAANLGLKVVY
jgi:outer membrane autotransporter protein